MEAKKIKLILTGSFLLLVGLFATCELTKPTPSNYSPIKDTLFLSQWRREKIEKLAVVKQYEKQLEKLEATNVNLNSSLIQHKKALAQYRLVAKSLQEKLERKFFPEDTSSLKCAFVYPLIDSLIINQNKGDTLCDVAIFDLENMVANRDSSIVLHKQIENNLRDLQKEQDLKNQYLTEQLNIAFKNQQKESRHNRLLAGGILILSGLATSLLLTQFLK